MKIIRALLNTFLLSVFMTMFIVPAFMILSLRDLTGPTVLGATAQKLAQVLPEADSSVWISSLTDTGTRSSDLLTYSYRTRDRKTVPLYSVKNLTSEPLILQAGMPGTLFGESVPQHLYLLTCTVAQQCESGILYNPGVSGNVPLEFTFAPQEVKTIHLLIESFGEGDTRTHNASFELTLAFRPL